jgi:hypothetical protein
MRRSMWLTAWLVGGLWFMTASASAQPALGISGNRFTINGSPRFLVFVSYFDAMRASDGTLHGDFQYFHDHGIDGVRIFPNWWLCADTVHCGGNYGNDTLFDQLAFLRPDRLAQFKHVLDLAGQHGLVVDVSFARETVPGISTVDEIYEAGLDDAASALAGGYPHVMFDLQNEVTVNPIAYSDPGRDADFVGQIKFYLPDHNRKVYVSTSEGGVELYAYGPSPSGPDDLPMDVMAPHDARVPGWQDRVPSVVSTLLDLGNRRGQKPVYLQEPTCYQVANRKSEDDTDINHFFTAIINAKNAGAAGWTFHTRKGFILRDQSFRSQMETGDQQFIEGFRSRIGQ